MATKPVGKVIYSVLAGDDDVAELMDDKHYPSGGVPQEVETPYSEYVVVGNVEELDLDGTADDCVAEVSITVTAATYEDCQACLAAIAEALDGISETVGDIVVTDSQVSDVTDQPNGPIDLDDAQVYQGDLTVKLAYT